MKQSDIESASHGGEHNEMVIVKYLHASEKAAKYVVNHLKLGQLELPGSIKDISIYYKLPTLLLISGRLQQANAVLDYIKKNFMMSDGDFRSNPEVKTTNGALKEHYIYINGWIMMAAQRLARFDISYPAVKFVDQYRVPSLGSYVTNKGSNVFTDSLTTSHFGLFNLYFGDLESARNAGDLLKRYLDLQPDMEEGFYIRMSNQSHLITDAPAGAEVFYIVKKKSPNQLYFFLGYPIAFLSKLYLATEELQYLMAAKKILDFCLACDESIKTFHFAHKVAWGGSIVSRITKEKKYADFVTEIADYLVSIQTENGTFAVGQEDNDLYDQTVEIATWLREIHSELTNMVQT